MKSKIEEIYFETEGCGKSVENSEEYKKIKKDYDKLYEEFNSGLNANQKKILDDLFLLSAGMESEASFVSFKEGVKTAFLVLLDILT